MIYIINEYLKNGYSLIPINAEKKPYVYWKSFQYKKANIEDVFDWYDKFNNVNIGIVTGSISKLVVIDVDKKAILPKLLAELPELKNTARVKTKRCCHLYFSLNGNGKVKATNNFLGLGVELKSDGQYVIAPPSKIEDFAYTFEEPLTAIKALPDRIIKLLKERTPDDIEYKGRVKLSQYHGKDVFCINQIAQKGLQVEGRTNGLLILYNLLLQNNNEKEYSQKIVNQVNNSLTEPLTEKEINNIFRKAYKYKCSSIRELLPFIECDKCKYRFKGGRLGMGNVIVKNIRKLPGLSNAEAKVVLMLGTVFEGEEPSNYAIAKETGMDKRTVKEAIEGLKRKGIIK